MAEQTKCVQPAKGPIESAGAIPLESAPKQEERKMLARVGKPAPDFELSAFHNGSFKNIRLSDYKGKWMIICFYPGDFTFV